MKVFNTDRARHLRVNKTREEHRLWQLLQNRQLGEFKFRRQVPRGNYIVDFLCAEEKLVVELDGRQHGTEYDQRRTAWLESQGYRVLRIPNCQVMENLGGVTEEILVALRGDPADFQ